MPPGIGGIGADGLFSGRSVTAASVVRIIAATEAAFCRAERVTFKGSIIPESIILTQVSLAAS